jgi:putative ABC transport system substrate-binding protein
LQERGYIWGQNLVIECRYTEGREERAPTFAAELLNLKPDLIFAYGSAQVRAAKQATSSIPIVMGGVIDPVEQGLVASLAQPGGNVTGLTFSAGREIVGKHLQLLKEAVPKASRVAVLGYTGTPAFYQREMEAAAQALDVTLQSYEVRTLEEFEGAFAAITKARSEALLVLPHVFISNHRKRIVDLVAQSRLPAVYPYREAAEAGGLMGYGANVPAIWRRFGLYIDKIFKGANPGDLPVEQPTKFDLVINLKAAKALGLTIPQSLLMRADEVIE